MEAGMCKTGSSQEQSISGINWDLVDNFIEEVHQTLPDNAITRQRIESHYGIKDAQAGRRMRQMRESGMFHVHKYKNGGGVGYYLLPKEV